MQGRAAERGRDADVAREERQRPFARLVEESLRREPLLQLLERELERAAAERLEPIDDELQIAARRIERDLAADNDALAVGGREDEDLHRAAEHHAAQVAAVVLQREVEVPGARRTQVRDLARDENVRELGRERLAQEQRQLRHRERRRRAARTRKHRRRA